MENKGINRLDMKSADIVSENIEKIRKIFPNVVKDGKIDFNVLKQELSNELLDNSKEKYQLTWVGKKESIINANARTNKTLRPEKEKSVEFNATKNIYIEGDNLEVLKILQESYLNKIKCIYIDPPYNTGNDFIYNDNFNKSENNELSESGQIDELNNRLITNVDSNGKYHSDWLSMIYPRLKLARNLLTNDGIIFISIDDNEQANLKKICDEIFGERNFITCVSRATGTPTGGGFDGVVNELDYLLVYAKNSSETKIFGLPMSEEDSKIYNLEDERGKYLIRPLRRTGGEDRREDRPTMFFPIIAPDGTEIYPIGPTGYESRWICSPETAKKLNEDGLLEWKKDNKENKWNVYQKFYLENRTKAPGNLWNDVEGNKKATRDIRELFDTIKVFDFPKPIGFIEKILDIATEQNDIILDFFSGSATTAHAVLRKNSIDNGTRKYILVQVPQKCSKDSEAYKQGYKTICEIGEERIKRAGKKIKEKTNADIDYGFRVYKVDSSNMKNIYYEPSRLSQTQLNMFESNIKDDRTAEDLLTQVILDLGLTLDLKIEEKNISNNKVYFVAGNSLVACFDNEINIDILNEICEIKPLKVVFRESSFRNDSDKINAYERIKKLSPETEISVI